MNRNARIFSGLVAIGAALAIWSFFIEPSRLVQKDLPVQHWTNPHLRIAFFSDLHAGSPYINEKYILNLTERINAMEPDLVLIGGDLMINEVVGGEKMPIEKVSGLLSRLKAPLGVYAVLGNHDWWNDADRIRASLESHGIKVLENQAELIKYKSSEFWLLGIGDHYTNHSDVDAAVSQVTSAAPRILFMHDPASLFQAKDSFAMALAGHLHGGQVYIPGIGALITPGAAPKSWAAGWVDFRLGSLYVSKGVGTSILPVRMNALPEFVILDLKP